MQFRTRRFHKPYLLFSRNPTARVSRDWDALTSEQWLHKVEVVMTTDVPAACCRRRSAQRCRPRATPSRVRAGRRSRTCRPPGHTPSSTHGSSWTEGAARDTDNATDQGLDFRTHWNCSLCPGGVSLCRLYECMSPRARQSDLWLLLGSATF